MSWFKLHRGWYKDPLFPPPSKVPFSVREVWIWLMEEAMFEETIININGSPVRLSIGQLSHSTRFMASHWGWNRGRVLRYLNKLKKWSKIETQIVSGQSVITVCNYCEYQSGSSYFTSREQPATEPRLAPELGLATDQRIRTQKTKKLRTKDSLVELHYFQEFWDHFPRQRRGSQQKALKAYRQALGERRTTENEIMKGLKNYEGSSDVQQGYAKGAAAWLNDDGWSNEYSNAKAIQTTPQGHNSAARNLLAGFIGEDYEALEDNGSRLSAKDST